MDVEGDMEDRVGIQVRQLESIEIKKVVEERAAGQIGSTGEEGTKNDLVILIEPLRDVIHFQSGPLNHWLRR